jgi:predicted lipoprotein with Yx(FWY)xxD motif
VKNSLLYAGALMALIVAAAACGTPYSGSGAGGATGSATIGVRSSQLGQFLADGSGRTVYLFEADKGATSACYSTCASVWPPLTTAGNPQALSGVTSSELGTTSRTDGKTQVTYNGHPLYYYVGDGKAGDTSGQGLNQFGAGWYVLSPAGAKIDNG